MPEIVDGTPVDAATTNPAFLGASVDDTASGKLTLNNLDSVSGPSIVNIQREHNSIASFVGKAINQVFNYLPTFVNSQGFTAMQSIFDRIEALSGKFHSSTGHNHDGSPGNGQPIDAISLINVKLKGSVIAGTVITGATGSSSDVSADFPTQNPSSGDTVKGVVVIAPNNKVVVRQATGANAGDAYVDGSGNVVYARLTNSGGVGGTWTLSYYVMIGTTETAYSFSSPSDVQYYYQQLYNPIVDAPIYSEYASVPSDNATADVVDASATQRGLVSTGTQTFAGNKTFTGTIGAANLSGINTGDVSLGAVGSSPNANGASLSGQVLMLQPADGTNPGLLSILAQSIAGIKTFINNMVLQAKMIFTWSVDSTTTGSNATLAAPGTVLLKLTNGSLVSIQEISGGAAGVFFAATNLTSVDLLLKNETGTAGNQVRTGTGADVTWTNKSTLLFYYDATTAYWYLAGGSGGGGGGGKYVVSAVQTIASGGTITSANKARQLLYVKGSVGGGGNAASITPFGNSDIWDDGTEIQLQGYDDSDFLTLLFNDAAFGLVGNFTSEDLTNYKGVTCIWDKTRQRWLTAILH